MRGVAFLFFCSLEVSFATIGCVAPLSATCADGRLCPAGKLCGSGGKCLDPAQVSACEGVTEGGLCTLPGTSNMATTKLTYCHGGACVVAECGNGVLDRGEVCDDHNTNSGDGCSQDCRKLEVCGDGVVDFDPATFAGEACDDANTDPADGCDACHGTAWAYTSVATGDLPCIMGGICPAAVVVDATGRRYIADAEGHRVYRLEVGSSTVTPIAGTGVAGFSGDGGAALGAMLDHPAGLALDAAGNLYVADRDNNRVRRVDAQSGVITTLAGTGAFGFAGDHGAPAAGAVFRGPTGLFLDPSSQRLYVADTGNHVVRAVDLSGGAAAATISTIAGTPAVLGFDGDCVPSKATNPRSDYPWCPATEALLYLPQAVTRCGNGDLFIADTGSHLVRRVEASTGAITSVIGARVADSSGQGQPAREFPLDTPLGLGCDTLGNLYVSSSTTVRILPADGNGVVDGAGPVLDVQLSPVSPDPSLPAPSLFVVACVDSPGPGPAPDALGLLAPPLRGLTGLAVVDDKSIVVVQSCTGMLIELGRRVLP